MVSFLKKIINYKRSRFWGTMSPENFVTYLEKNGVKVGQRVNFRYPKSVTIDLTRPLLIRLGNDLDINANFSIMTHDFCSFVFRNCYDDFLPSSGEVTIGNNIYFGRDVTILKGVTIGDNCIIGAGSIITKSIPSNSVAAGVPCKVLCTLDEYYSRRKKEALIEAIQYAKVLRRKYGSICPGDLTEEWAIFLTEEDYLQYPEFKRNAEKRLGNKTSKWLSESRQINGYSQFLELVKDEDDEKER